MAAGEWRSRRTDGEPKPIKLMHYLTTRRPSAVGFHIPSLISTFVILSDAAAAFLEGKTDLDARQDFSNAHKAEACTPRISARKEDDILGLRDDQDRVVVPSEPLVALAAVSDTQDDGFWYEIRAWGPYPDLESWQVREGFAISIHAKDFSALERILFKEIHKDLNGIVYRVQLAWVDTEGHRTAEVYDWCRKHYPRVWGPEAKPFRRWVTHDVLPSIRKHGSYETEEGGSDVMTRPQLAEVAFRVKLVAAMAMAFGFKGARRKLIVNDVVHDAIGIETLKVLGVKDEVMREYETTRSETEEDSRLPPTCQNTESSTRKC